MFIYLFNTRIRKYFYKEFWPKPLLLMPVLVYIFYLGIKARSFFFFSACNPGIVLGGLTGDSKYPVINQIPTRFLPKTLFVPKGSNPDITTLLQKQHFDFPLICKPDIGEGGVGVEKIYNDIGLSNYMKIYDEDFLIQEYIPGTNEITLMYCRIPGQKKGKIDFIATKKFLSVTGDGRSSLKQLVRKGKRTRLFEHMFREDHAESRNTIIPKKETHMLQFKGNHGQGTAMFDGSRIITPKLHDVFDEIADNIDGFFLGRYDIKYDNLDTFMQGDSFKILDLNGVGSDLHHTYDLQYSLFDLWKIWKKHLDIIYKIARINHSHGAKYPNYREYKDIVSSFKKNIKKFR